MLTTMKNNDTANMPITVFKMLMRFGLLGMYPKVSHIPPPIPRNTILKL